MLEDENDGSDERLNSDGEQSDAPVEDDDVQPEIPFDAEKMEMVIDFRAVCSLPYDYDTDGIKSLRAILFGKGKGIHAPKEAGKLFVSGDWKLLHSLATVHFVPSTHRKPELLLSFVDYGFANASMQGISVETLSLPLLVKKGVYQDACILTGIKDVAGFTTINQAQAPWSMTLKPALQRQDFFNKSKIFNTADINKWLASQKMSKRVESLAKRARSEMDEAVKEIRRQDPSQATKTKARFEARLSTVLVAIDALPPSAYDVRMSTRVIQLLEDRDFERDPCWMTSPIQQRLRDGTSDYVRTRLLRLAAPIPEPVEAIRAVNIEGEPDQQEDQTEGPTAAAPAGASQFSDLELSADESDDSELEETRSPSKRVRKAPPRLEPEAAPGAKKGKATPRTAPAKDTTTNPKTGAAWKRGPYRKPQQTAAKVLEKAKNAAMKKELKQADTKVEVASLKIQLKAALEGKKAVEEQLQTNNKLVELEISKARAEGKNEGLRASAEEYKKGVAAGAAIATGKAFRYVEESPIHPSSAASSSSIPHMHSF